MYVVQSAWVIAPCSEYVCIVESRSQEFIIEECVVMTVFFSECVCNIAKYCGEFSWKKNAVKQFAVNRHVFIISSFRGVILKLFIL